MQGIWLSSYRLATIMAASLAMTGLAQAQHTIFFTTESYPPFTYTTADGTYKGIAIDQIAVIMRDVGHGYGIEMMPWARAITLAETQPWHCAFATARTPDREPRFKWVVPLYVDRSILVRHASAAIKTATLDEAKRFTVGTHRGDYTEQVLKQLGFETIDLSADVDTTLRKLLGERIDLMPMSESVFNKLKADGTPIADVMVLSEQELGIACNLGLPDDVIHRLRKNLRAMIDDGTQAAIERRYGINRLP
jgi:polar amino acid transport system substrate-binding protein